MVERGDLALFRRMCPNCGGEIGSGRLDRGLPCGKCLPEADVSDLAAVCHALEHEGKLEGLGPACELSLRMEDFTSFFKGKVGSSPWSLQLSWAKRVLMGRSFAILAPTGVGKTTFGLVMAAFLPRRSYIIVPTKLLVEELSRRLRGMVGEEEVLGYIGRKGDKERVRSGDFRILVTTNAFLQRNFSLLAPWFRPESGGPGFFFIDDVDSFLKASRNIDRLLELLGFSPQEIAAALRGRGDAGTASKAGKGILVVSSATAQPRTKRVILFQRLLGFSVQRTGFQLRKVVDVVEKVGGVREGLSRAAELIRELGPGCFLYLPQHAGQEGIAEAVEALGRLGLEAIPYQLFRGEARERFQRGEVPVAVGLSHQGNPLVRGIDLPEAVRYAIFVGTPVIRIPARPRTPTPGNIFRLLLALRPVLPPEERERTDACLESLRPYLDMGPERLERYPKIKGRLEEALSFLNRLLGDREVLAAALSSPDVPLVEEKGELFLLIGDGASYLQASGRTSRLTAAGLTQGLAVLFYHEPKAFHSLRRRLRALHPGIRFLKLGEVDLDGIRRRIDADRERLRGFLSGKIPGEREDHLRTSLMVVESPNKAGTIAGFFGRPQRRWLRGIPVLEVCLEDRLLVIAASLGHLTDLVEGEGIHGVLDTGQRYIPIYAPIRACTRCGEQTTGERCPRCGQPPDTDKLETLLALRELALEVDEVLVATDPDAEGEKIAWDIYLALRPLNPSIRRVEFHEVTPEAIRTALKSPRDISLDSVKAQMVRRIADRWVGFSLSQHIQARYHRRNLSAGRVQTPVLGWTIRREEERRRLKGVIRARVDGFLLTMEHPDPKEAEVIFRELHRARVSLEDEGEGELSPPPPHNTASLLVEAGEKLRLPAPEAMACAQELFEKGLITYHRTDSVRVSPAGIRVAEEYIAEAFGREFFSPRRWAEGGAHECIRPTRPLDPEGLREALLGEYRELRPGAIPLYRLIWERFLASQMREVRVSKGRLIVEVKGFRWEEEVILGILSHGFDLVLPLEVARFAGERLSLQPVELRAVPAAPPLTQAALVQLMRQRGLGRPSTYAKIVSTLLERRYVVERKGFLFPTRLGRDVYRYLSERFPRWTSEEFTRELEKRMDLVESGEADHQEVLRELQAVVEEVGG